MYIYIFLLLIGPFGTSFTRIFVIIRTVPHIFHPHPTITFRSLKFYLSYQCSRAYSGYKIVSVKGVCGEDDVVMKCIVSSFISKLFARHDYGRYGNLTTTVLEVKIRSLSLLIY